MAPFLNALQKCFFTESQNHTPNTQPYFTNKAFVFSESATSEAVGMTMDLLCLVRI